MGIFAWRSQLRLRLLLGIVLVILTSAISIDVAVQRTLSRELPQVEIQSVTYQARRLQRALEESYAQHGTLSTMMLAEPPYLPLRIYRADGSVVEASTPLPRAPLADPVSRALGGERVETIVPYGDDRRYGSVVLPLHGPDGIVGALEVAQELHPIAPFQETIRRDLATTTMIALSALVAFCVFLGMRFGTALDEIKAQTAAIVGGNFERRVPVTTRDEIGQIGTYLNQMAESLQRLTKTRNEFLSKVSHELRTPLTIAQGFSSLLRHGELLPGQERTVSIIDDQLAELTRLVNDLLDLSRREHGGLALHPAPIDCAALVNEVVEQHRGLMADKGIALTARCRASLSISGDRQRLHQVLGNLLGNAGRYSRSRIGLELDAEPQHAVIRVRDDGPGIAPADLSRIFEPFCQLPGETPGRAGLGLAVVRELVQAHGGTIAVESTVGAGTCFTIRLPRQPVAAERPATGSLRPALSPRKRRGAPDDAASPASTP